MKKFLTIYLIVIVAFSSYRCASDIVETSSDKPFVWENATVYFLLTDRFNNGNTENDVNFGRTNPASKHRTFMGGDIQGVIDKIESGYFTDLGVDAIWLTPVVEQVHGSVDEGQGETYAYHGYWAKDWTTLDPNFGTEEEFAKMVELAHEKGIRILLDVVINQHGPETDKDPRWSDDWVRTEPRCVYEDFNSTVPCTLVENLPDIRTDSDEEVELPSALVEKWKAEGRLESEVEELEAFFARTGYKKAPRFYLIKWLSDFIRKYGIDGFRVDTVKHVEPSVWAELWAEAREAFEDWKKENPDKAIHDNEFFMVGEVYGYSIQEKQLYHYSDTTVNYFDYGFQSLINFSFKSDAGKDYEELFSEYSAYLNDSLGGKWVMNYISSHDDSWPFDKMREHPLDAGTKLMLTPGATQIYYGDELARSLVIDGEEGDANLRSFMNWEDLENNKEVKGVSTQAVLNHWQKLGKFRQAHPAVGAGRHEIITEEPYTFKRSYNKGGVEDEVVVALSLPAEAVTVSVGDVFADGDKVKDCYSGKVYSVNDGSIVVEAEASMVLLEAVN